MPPCLLPMREDLPPIRMKDECRHTSANRNRKDHQRCGSSKSTKSCGPPISPISDPLSKLALLLKNRQCKDIIIMAGAGISTASGIPDFRSPGTGLYYNTSKYNVSCPTDVFDLKYFNKNPYPFMDIIRDFIKTEKDPNNTHGFCKLLETKGLLLRMYTQNIDGLEKKSGISPSRLVEAHGTMETSSCVKCLTPHSTTRTEKMIINGKIPSCKRKGCGGYVKPDIIMFGEELPKKFYLYPKDFEKCDLLLIMGTSLNVEPFSELVDAVPKSVPRVLFNRDSVGPFADSRRKNDIFIRGDIGDSINRLVKMLGWSKALSGISDNIGSDGERSSSRADSGISDLTVVTRTTTSTSNTPDSIPKTVSHPTWAASRASIAKVSSQISSQITQDSLSMPNSVVRNVSDQCLAQRVSALSLTESISTASKSDTISSTPKPPRTRSVSAPLPKNSTSKITISTVPSSTFTQETVTNSSETVDTIVSTVLSPASSKSTFIGQDMINVQDNTENKNPNIAQETPILEERRSDNDTALSSISDCPPSESEHFLKMKVLKSEEDLVWMSNPLGSSVKQIPKQLPLISEQPAVLKPKETLYDTVKTVMSTYSDISIQNIKSEVSNLSDKGSVETVLSCTPATILNGNESSMSTNTVTPSRLSVTKTPISLVKRRSLDKNVMTLKGLANKEQTLPSQMMAAHVPPEIPTQRSFSSLLTPDTSDVLKTELKTFITKKLKATAKREEKAVKERKLKKSTDSPSTKKKLPFSVPKAASPKANSSTKDKKNPTKANKDVHQWRLSPSEVEVLAKGHLPSTLSVGVGKKFVSNGISSKSWSPGMSTHNSVSRRNVKKQVVLYSVGISSKPDYKWITKGRG